jgi:hypothetical protein
MPVPSTAVGPLLSPSPQAARRKRRPAGAAVLLGLAALLGSSCSGGNRLPVYPVRGQVFYDGKPAARALVIFHPLADGPVKELRPAGHVAADGTFALTTYAEGDGAPAGDYAVTVDWRQPTPPVDGAEPGPSLIPARYNSPSSSGLTVTVSSGHNDLEPINLARR